MDLREVILKEHSKKQCNKIVEWVGHSQERFNELFRLFISDEKILSQQAAWPLSYCAISNSIFIIPTFMSSSKTSAGKIFTRPSKEIPSDSCDMFPFPKNTRGPLWTFVLTLSHRLLRPVKAFSLSVLANLGKQYPDILPELKLIIEEQAPYQSPAFIARAKKIAK